ncbi:DUF6879 family protein [Amycolatopsis sp. NPDC059027]|uniref:DUF6879 family protein n=1 Tax=Amycolatopsis sp. NPDC059027 TaxID=3346709 RepID=UPI003673171C
MRLSRDEFQGLFDEDWTTAWRWECQGTYREPKEQSPARRFLAGDRDLTWFRPWQNRVRAWRREGRRMARVRMLTDPLTDYLRYQLFLTAAAIEAGEEILFIDESHAVTLGAPKEDYWLFDDSKVAVLAFGEAGVKGATLITDSGEIRPYLDWRATVTPVAFPHTNVEQ